jgi:hypothetical protein
VTIPIVARNITLSFHLDRWQPDDWIIDISKNDLRFFCKRVQPFAIEF